MMFKLITSVFLFFTITACNDLSIMPGRSADQKILGLSTLSAMSGDKVSFTGTEIDDRLSVLVDGIKVEHQIVDPEAGYFIFPGSKGASSKIQFVQGETTIAQFPIVNQSSIDDIPVAEIPAEQLCSDIIVRNSSGGLVKGLASCVPEFDDCSKEGQTNCLSQEDFRHVFKEGLAEKLIAGEIVAGIEGTISRRSPYCTRDGEQDCIVDGTKFVALSVEALDPDDFISSRQLAGVQGSLIVTPPACLSEGQVQCLTSSDFPSVEKSYVNSVASSFESSLTLVGVQGRLDNCSEDGETACFVRSPNFVNVSTVGAASKISIGQTFAGIQGQAPTRPADCSSDGQSNCVTVTTYPALDKSNLLAQTNKFGVDVTIAGVSGVLSICSSEGQTSCVTQVNFPAADKLNISSNLAKIRNSLNLLSSAGTLGDCSIDGATSCMTGPNYPAMDKGSAPAKILAGQTLGSVSGTALPRPSDCTSDGAVACTTVSDFPAMDASNSPAKISVGQTLAGVAGTAALRPVACSADYETSCVAHSTFPALKKLDVTSHPEKYGSSLTIAGTQGLLDDCAADGVSDCRVVGPLFKATDVTALAAKIAVGQNLAGVAGSVATKPADCSIDGEISCATNSGFHAFDKNAAPFKIVFGQSLGGVTGTALNYRPADCADDGEIGCTTVSPYPAMQKLGADLLIAAGDTLGGVAGNAAVRPSDCSVENAKDCIATPLFPSIDKSLVDSSKSFIRASFTLVGITGTMSSCTVNGQTACLTNASFPSIQSSGAASKILTGYTLGGITGTAPLRPLDCQSDGHTSCVAVSQYPAIQSSSINAGKLRNGLTLGGVAGSLSLCSSDGQTNCEVGPNYSAMENLAGVSSKILAGQTLGGVLGTGAGRPSECSASYVAGCVSITNYPAISVAAVTANKPSVHSSLTLAGIAGELLDCSSDGMISCLAVVAYKSMSVAGAAAKIAASQVLGGVLGSAATKPANCASDGETQCTTTAGFVSVDSTLLSAKANKILSGTSIAGVAGTLPSCSSDGELGCASNSIYRSLLASGAGAKIQVGQSLGGITGTAPLRPANCSADNQSNCVATSIFPAIDKTTLTNNRAKILSSLTIAGLSGNLPSCTSNGQADCLTSSSNPSVVATNVVAANIKNASTVGGVVGQYPSASYPLSGSTVTGDLTSSNFLSRLVSASNFEWFSPQGFRYSGSGTTLLASANLRKFMFGIAPSFYQDCNMDAEVGCVTVAPFKALNVSTVDPWNFQNHLTLGGIQGKLYFPTNGSLLTLYNRQTGDFSSSSTTVADAYDSTDDDTTLGNAYPLANSFSSSVPIPGWKVATEFFIRDAATDTNANGQCDGTEKCIYYDKVTQKRWSRIDTSTGNWEASIAGCINNVNAVPPLTGWRLPTQKEAQQAYIHGLSAKAFSEMNMPAGTYHVATTQSTNTTGTFFMDLNTGMSSNYITKSSLGRSFFCVHD